MEYKIIAMHFYVTENKSREDLTFVTDILISTDTTADLTDDFVRENSIDIHTLFYAFGEQLYGPETKCQ